MDGTIIILPFNSNTVFFPFPQFSLSQAAQRSVTGGREGKGTMDGHGGGVNFLKAEEMRTDRSSTELNFQSISTTITVKTFVYNIQGIFKSHVYCNTVQRTVVFQQ